MVERDRTPPACGTPGVNALAVGAIKAAGAGRLTRRSRPASARETLRMTSCLRTLVLLLAAASMALCQVPGFGYCPELEPLVKFDMSQFQGMWYEAERMFAVVEAGSRCVASNYSVYPDGKVKVNNEITSRLTGIKRVLEGDLQMVGRGGEAKMSVKYTSLPVAIDSDYMVLATDYKSYAVVWSCGSLGPFNTQSSWILTRQRKPSPEALQKAYGVLDKNNIRRTFFVSSDQENCEHVPAPTDAPTTTVPVVEGTRKEEEVV